MTLNDIWRSFHPPKSNISEIVWDTSTETEIVNKKSNVCFQVLRMSIKVITACKLSFTRAFQHSGRFSRRAVSQQ